MLAKTSRSKNRLVIKSFLISWIVNMNGFRMYKESYPWFHPNNE